MFVLDLQISKIINLAAYIRGVDFFRLSKVLRKEWKTRQGCSTPSIDKIKVWEDFTMLVNAGGGKNYHFCILFAACLVFVLPLSVAQPLAQAAASSAVASRQAHVWVVDMLTFAHSSAAQSLIARLANKGLHAEIVTTDIAGEPQYRVQSQPFAVLDDALNFRNSLRNNTNLQADDLSLRGENLQHNNVWRIDIIRFATKSKARDLIKKLRRKGFTASMSDIQLSGMNLYQVSILPFDNMAEVRAYRSTLMKKTNLTRKHLKIVSPPQNTVFTQADLNTATKMREHTAIKPQPAVTQVDDLLQTSHSQRIKGGSKQGNDSQVFENPDALLPDWRVYGSNTIRSDIYKSKGNLAATPYRFSSAHSYDELSLNAERIFSPFNRITAQISGLLYNDSLYRSQFPGMVLERVNLRQENGDFFIPYRAEVGDFFAFQSYRTIQRSLKGGRVEFQPQWHVGRFRHSIELFSGSASPDWDTFQFQDDFSSGASWLVQHPLLGSLAANLVLNHKQANGFAQPGLRQRVGSLAWEKRGAMLGQQLVVEAEAGRFIGDHPLILAGRPNIDRQGNGFFGQVSGVFDALPQLSYRVRGESYEQDYFPNGASIQSDRTSQEAYLTWRDSSGLAFTSRFQHYHTAWQTNNPTDIITYGGNISGMIPLFGGISGSIDAFGSDVESRDLTTNTMAKVVNANLSKQITENLSVRGGFYYANNNKKNSPLGLNITRQYNGAFDYRLQWQGISGTISIGSLARRIDQQGRRWWEGNPTFNANLIYGKHSLSLALSKLVQDSLVANQGVDTMTAALNYRYTQPKYTIGLDANWYDRQPSSAAVAWTNAWRVGAYLTYNFDRPIVKLAMTQSTQVSDASQTAASIERMRMDISRITLGMPVADARALVSATGLGEPGNQAGFLIWYAQIFRDMNENQRLVLDVQQQHLLRSSVVIDFLNPDDSAGIRMAFERMRRQLLAVYGQPDAFFDQGDFGSSLATELAAGHFIRVMEWKRDGGTLRFGIPRRLDGTIRMELQFANTFPGLKDTLWSMEGLQ